MNPSVRAASPQQDGAGQITLGELLRDRSFMLYLVGQTTSGAGGALSSVALVFAVLAIHGTAASVGLVLLASRLPGIALSLIGGIIADRWSRQRIAVSADATRAVVQAVTGGLLVAGHASVPALAGLQLLTGGASAMFAPAAGALAAAVAPRGQLRRATSLLGMTTAIAQTGGLALSGVIVAVAGPGMSLLLDSATFAVSAFTLALMPCASTSHPPQARVRRDLRAGMAALTERRWVFTYALHETTLNVCVLSPFFVLGPVIARAHLGGATGWSAIALGYVTGNLTAAHITYHWAPRRPILAALVMSLGLVPLLLTLGVEAPLWVIVPAALLAGAQSTIYNTLANASLQANLPHDTLGRALAITALGSTVLVPVGMGLTGLLADAVGTTAVLVGGAAIVVLTTVLCASPPATRQVLSLDTDH